METLASLADVTIIIPVYCTTEQALVWLDECLASAVAQGCEVVCWDDGSTQDVKPVLRKYKLDYHGGNHEGVSKARNSAVDIVSTRLIYPLDCDDTLKPGSITQLLSLWNGSTPVYSDVAKFGLVNVPHYNLLEFDCNHIRTHVGFSSVNVLHLKAQWEALGGWDPTIDFYEDGEYNARLYARWCGVRCPHPLVNYRIHDNQRTKTYAAKASEYAKRILDRIRRLDMPCSTCGGKRRATVVTAQPVQQAAAKIDPKTLPGEMNGRVLAQYVGGKGKGKHYYQGPTTRYMYKVTYGDYVYADPTDTRTAEEIMTKPNWLLVKYIGAPIPVPQQAPAPTAVATPAPVQAAPQAPKPIQPPAVERTPVPTTMERKPAAKPKPKKRHA